VPYIGNPPAEKYASYDVQHITTSATSSYVLDKNVANENEIRVVLNNVIQQPGSSYAYTASGNTLTLSAATTSSDKLYVVFTGKAVQTVTPPPSSVGLAQFNATGSPGNNTFLRGDNSWATPSDSVSYLVKISADDTTPDFLNGKLVAGTGISLTEGSGGGDETLTIANTSTGTISAFTNGADNRLVTATSATALNGESTLTYDGTNLDLPDAKKIRLGNGNDCEFFHDGDNTYLFDNGTGDLRIKGSNVKIQSGTGEDFIDCNADGSVELYHNNVNMVETYSSGVWMKDNKTLKFGDGADGSIVSDGTNFKYQVANGAIAIFTANRYAFSDYSNAVLKLDIGTNGSISAGDVFDSYYRIQARFSGNSGAGIVLDNSDTNTNTTTYLNFKQGNSSIGSVQRNGTNNAVAYNTSSDYRLKDNVSYDFDATTRLKELKPARFNWKSNPSEIVDGFIAHEVSSVIPEAITGVKDEVEKWKQGEELPEGKSVGDNKLDENGNTIPLHQQIDQSKLVPLLVKSLQEALAEIDILKTKVTALENA